MYSYNIDAILERKKSEMSVVTKTERIDIRLTKENKNILDQAANINNTTVSDYILSIVLKRAELDIKENEKIVLSSRASKQILDALSNPGEPNEELVKLFR